MYTQPDRPAGRGRHLTPPPVKVVAQELGLPIQQPESLRDARAIGELSALSPDAGVAVAYGQILPPEALAIPAKGVLNVHPSLLPRHRGASPIPAAILAGDDETGVSIILMDAGMDSGPIVAQRSLPIEDTDTTGTLTDKLAVLAAELLGDTLPLWLNGDIETRAQDDSLVTKAPMLKKEQGEIDWSLPAVQIWRRVRAYNPWPGAGATLDGQRLLIWEAWPTPDGTSAAPGTIVSLDDALQLPPGLGPAGFGVQTGDGILAVITVQREGRRRMAAGEFALGMRGLFGRRLGAA